MKEQTAAPNIPPIVVFLELENSDGVHCECMGEHEECVFHLYPASAMSSFDAG